MIGCTEEAARALDAFRAQLDIPPSYGLRIFAVTTDDGRAGVRMAFAREPHAGDAVSEEQGQAIFVARDIAPRIAGLELDVEPDLESVGLVLRASGRN
jgi:Fe-S cluster assembly iron-binding protein IscA